MYWQCKLAARSRSLICVNEAQRKIPDSEVQVGREAEMRKRIKRASLCLVATQVLALNFWV